MGKLRREIFGGASNGLTLVNEGAVPCMHDVSVAGGGNKKESGYQLHAGSTGIWSSVCFDADTYYHVAVPRGNIGKVTMFVNGRDVGAEGHNIEETSDSVLSTSSLLVEDLPMVASSSMCESGIMPGPRTSCARMPL